MSRVPRYPYRCIVTRRIGTSGQQIEQHNYTTLAGAIAFRDTCLRRPDTRRVELVMVIDETTPAHSQQQEEMDTIRAFRTTSDTAARS